MGSACSSCGRKPRSRPSIIGSRRNTALVSTKTYDGLVAAPPLSSPQDFFRQPADQRSSFRVRRVGSRRGSAPAMAPEEPEGSEVFALVHKISSCDKEPPLDSDSNRGFILEFTRNRPPTALAKCATRVDPRPRYNPYSESKLRPADSPVHPPPFLCRANTPLPMSAPKPKLQPQPPPKVHGNRKPRLPLQIRKIATVITDSPSDTMKRPSQFSRRKTGLPFKSQETGRSSGSEGGANSIANNTHNESGARDEPAVPAGGFNSTKVTAISKVNDDSKQNSGPLLIEKRRVSVVSMMYAHPVEHMKTFQCDSPSRPRELVVAKALSINNFVLVNPRGTDANIGRRKDSTHKVLKLGVSAKYKEAICKNVLKRRGSVQEGNGTPRRENPPGCFFAVAGDDHFSPPNKRASQGVIGTFRVNKMCIGAPTLTRMTTDSGTVFMRHTLDRRSSIEMSASDLSRRLDSSMDTTIILESGLAITRTDVDGHKYINQYMLLDKLGKGHSGVVKLCFDTQLHRKVAMKIMNKARLKKLCLGKDKNAYKLVENEIAIMKKMCHPNIVLLYEIIDDPKSNKLYLVMQFVGGGTLMKRIKAGRIPLDKCWKYFRELMAGLEYCHDVAGIIHRDIKPENLLLDENNTLYLSDFGVSFVIENGSDEARATFGSAYFMAPEICRFTNYKGRQTDIWAAGVTLYYMATGQLPFVALSHKSLGEAIINNAYVWLLIIRDRVKFPQDTEPTLQRLLEGMLQKDPAKRITLNLIEVRAVGERW